MIDLNNKAEFGGSSIFNDGNAGFVKGVKIRKISKKTSTDAQFAPDYNVHYNDGLGEVRQGFYYKPSGSENRTQQEIETHQKQVIQRMMSIASATVPADFKYPKLNSLEEAIDVIAKIINDHSEGKEYGLFVNYGTTNYPKEFLEVRYFDFIVPGDSGRVLTAKPADVLTRIRPDAPASGESSSAEGTDWFSMD